MKMKNIIDEITTKVNCSVDNTIEEFVLYSVNRELQEHNITVNAKKLAEAVLSYVKSEDDKGLELKDVEDYRYNPTTDEEIIVHYLACPSCGHYDEDINFSDTYCTNYNFCPKCGQKLDRTKK